MENSNIKAEYDKKNGELVNNLDYSNSGYLTIPYEITQYLDNAVNKYQGVDPIYINLRYDDKFIIIIIIIKRFLSIKFS